MLYVLGTFVLGAYHKLLGVVHVLGGDFGNLLRHCSREEEHLAIFGHMAQDVVYVVDKAHVEHLVGLVKNHGVYIVELHHATVYEVDESARCSHYHLHSSLKTAYLAFNA